MCTSWMPGKRNIQTNKNHIQTVPEEYRRTHVGRDRNSKLFTWQRH